MSGYYKLAVLAFLMLTASAIADAKLEEASTTMGQELLAAEIKALVALKEAENAIGSVYGDEARLRLNGKVMGEGKCAPSGHICSGFGPPEQCCSGSCVPHPYLRIFVCA